MPSLKKPSYRTLLLTSLYLIVTQSFTEKAQSPTEIVFLQTVIRTSSILI